MMCDFNKLKNGILGFIIGDSLGVPLEFKKRDLFKNNKVTDMISSMVIATMKSIIDNKGKINYESIMDNFILYGISNKFITIAEMIFPNTVPTKNDMIKEINPNTMFSDRNILLISFFSIPNNM